MSSSDEMVMDDCSISSASAAHCLSAKVGDPPPSPSVRHHLLTNQDSVVGRRESHSISSPGHAGPQTAMASLSKGKECGLGQAELAILDGEWPGVANPTLLTRFIKYHFSGDVEAYVPFSWWADSCLVKDPCVIISIGE